MTLFGKKKFGRGSPYIWSFLSGFLKEKRAYLCIFGLSNKTTTAHISFKNNNYMLLVTLRSSHLPMPGVLAAYVGSRTGGMVLYLAWRLSSLLSSLGSSLVLVFYCLKKRTKLGNFDSSKQLLYQLSCLPQSTLVLSCCLLGMVYPVHWRASSSFLK